MKKNDTFEANITALTSDGEGICHSSDGMAFFVKGALPGDTCLCGVTKLKKTYGYARLINIIRSSPDRIDPSCPIFGRCGGCALRNYTYEAELSFKEELVRSAVERIGGFSGAEILPIISADEGHTERYRNKAEIPVRSDAFAAAGFYAVRSHDVIPLPENDCLLQPEEFSDIIGAVLEWMDEKGITAYDEKTGSGLIRHIVIRKAFSANETMLCLVINSEGHPKAIKELGERLSGGALISTLTVNHNTRNTNVIFGERTDIISGSGYITEEIGDLRYRISAQSFFQVNPYQTKKLYQKVREFAALSGGERVWDLYCGTGTIGLFLAKDVPDVKLTGIEIVPRAVADAKENARENGIENAEFFCGKAEEIAGRVLAGSTGGAASEASRIDEGNERSAENVAPDVIIVDPPRKGCDENCLSTIVKASPSRLIYVSCNPATLARDMKYLRENGGYEPRYIQPIDMFPRGGHVETVCLLSNRKPDARVKIDVDLEDYYRIKDEQKKNKASE